MEQRCDTVYAILGFLYTDALAAAFFILTDNCDYSGLNLAVLRCVRKPQLSTLKIVTIVRDQGGGGAPGWPTGAAGCPRCAYA
jgi:hypothetical protein